MKNYLKVLGLGLLFMGVSTSIQAKEETSTQAETRNSLPPTPDYRANNSLPPVPEYRAYNSLPPTPDYRAYNSLPPTPDHPVPTETKGSSKDDIRDSLPPTSERIVKTRLDFTAFMRENYQHTRC